MRLNKILQKDYTLSSLYYQIKLPLDVEILIPADDPVRLLSAFVEGMELSDLYQTYGKIKKNQATPRQRFKIKFKSIMKRKQSTGHATSARFRYLNFSGKRLLRKIRQNFSIRSLPLWKSVKIFTVSRLLIMGKSLFTH